MAKCKTCGAETKKGRQECIGCRCVKEVARKKNKASNFEFEKAEKHLSNNPNLLVISWPSFFKRR